MALKCIVLTNGKKKETNHLWLEGANLTSCMLTDDHLCLLSVIHSAQGHYAQKLLNDLMENYSSALRPVDDTDRALNVTLQVTLSQIKDMVRARSSASLVSCATHSG